MSIRQPLIPAKLHWQNDTPEAVDFGDIYFSRDNGLDESLHVFLASNQLRERWQQLSEKSIFVIGETGFGTGLNFLLAWQLWLETAPKDAQLFFISTELHPLTQPDLSHALSHWSEIKPLSDELLLNYPALTPGFHSVKLANGRITLLLLLGDANETLPQLADAQNAVIENDPWAVDAWFLDGFAPAKNPQLWQDTLLTQIAALSKVGTTLATFTAVGQVRRELTTLGFSVAKVAGYGRKREMLTATLIEKKSTLFLQPETPWLSHSNIQTKPERVIVIGAGLAGCHIARTLAARNIRVTVIDQHAAPAQEASGNPQGALYTKLSANNAVLTQFGISSLQYALRHYQQPALRDVFSACGLLQLTEKHDQNLAHFLSNNPEFAHWIDGKEASKKSGIALTRGGWWLPQSGWIDPQRLCKKLLDHPLIETRFDCTISDIQREQTTWELFDSQKNLIDASAHLVIACAQASARFSQTQWLPLRAVRGQITTLPASKISQTLRCVVCDEGYLTPAHQQQHCLGASFVPDDTSAELRLNEQQHNLNLLRDISPALHEHWNNIELQGRAALRCTTPDHLPMVGALPNRDIFLQHYAKLRHNAKAAINQAGSYVDGLWLLTGFGGRGLCYIPLAAELLAAQMLHEPRPLPREIQQALAPARFVIRELVQTHAGR